MTRPIGTDLEKKFSFLEIIISKRNLTRLMGLASM